MYENQELKRVGLKVTLPRVKILNILEQCKHRHISAEEVYKTLIESGDDVGLATVYRVLTQFESAGLVVRHGFANGHAVFELDQGEHHDHLVCVRCSSVEEFIDPEIEARQEAIAAAKGFEMTEHCLYMYGICRACQEKKGV